MIDKPAGPTSHDVVNRVRGALKTRRVGHTGTLDPFATGVLVVLVGRATRLARFLDRDEKEYEAIVRFGFETDTGDITGTPAAGSRVENVVAARTVAETDWDAVFDAFRGKIEQVPPMYSAKKIGGRKLYESARKGVDIERQPITVEIKELELIELRTASSEVHIRVVCSAGTYIRTLAQDIGRKVGVGAHLSELRRTRAGRFGLPESISLNELEQTVAPEAALIKPDRAVEHLPAIVLDQARAAKTRNGLSTRIHDASFVAGEAVRMLDENGELLAVGIFDAADSSIRPKVVLV